MTKTASHASLSSRLAALDWTALSESLWEHGHARTGPLLSPDECAALRGLFGDDARFRKRIAMERYRYGAGDYAYFADPAPPLVRDLRTRFYRQLAPIANRWAETLGGEIRGGGPEFPPALRDYLARCHAAGQTRPTPLLLRYGEGGHNRLHQDRYGPLAFPFQAVILLSAPEKDFRGGAFMLVENRPREQSRGEAFSPALGEAVIFPHDRRPVPGKRGWRTARVRHGVATVTHGERVTLGLIFHDAV